MPRATNVLSLLDEPERGRGILAAELNSKTYAGHARANDEDIVVDGRRHVDSKQGEAK